LFKPNEYISMEDDLVMTRAVLSISISEELFDRMVDHWTGAGHASASEYVRELIRNDLRQNAGKLNGPHVVPIRRFKRDPCWDPFK